VYYELTLIEAFVVNGMFGRTVPRPVARRALKRAESVEPLFLKAKTDLISVPTETVTAEGLQEAAAKIKLQCPLNEEGGCVLYEYRPITCRLYGVPQKIANRVVSCPRSQFAKGDRYTTVDVNEIQTRLFEFAREFLEDMIGEGPSSPPGPLFFMATALKTQFDKDFFLSLKEGLR
jgi:Fe-S-cluster containining protein